MGDNQKLVGRHSEMRAESLYFDLEGWKMCGKLGCPRNKQSSFPYQYQIAINLHDLFKRLAAVHN